MESNLESFTGVMDLRDAMLQELGIYEMYRLMKLYHDWESVVGPMVNGQAKLVHIKPPVIVVELLQISKYSSHDVLYKISLYQGMP